MSVQLTSLRCEYLVNPLGLGVVRPRLSWEMLDDRRGARQTAYHVLVASSRDKLNDVDADVWNSGKVESDESIQVEYAGKTLASRLRCFWTVRIWDHEGQPSSWATPAYFELGLLKRDDWKASWIGSSVVGGPRTIPPCPYLRREFVIDKPVSTARLYVTALGLFECEINGKRVGDDVFAPGRTEYRKRVPYHVYDVISQLANGPNCVGAILGDGWYCGHVHSDPRMTYGDRPRLLLQLEITHADGSKQMVVSDGSWKVTTNGPIRSSDLLMGEDYDARMELGDWSKPGFDDSRWLPVERFDDPGIELVARTMPAVRRIDEIRPPATPTMSANKRRWTFDFGQNLVGRVRLKLRNTRPGQIITIRHAEMLDKSGKLYTEALRTARATDYYTCRGDAEETYEPRFTFHGFRYIEVNGLLPLGQTPPEDTATAIVTHTDLPFTGEFECSNPMLNQLQSNIRWSQKGNFLEIPTDCPQRDERLGWTGDAQVFIRTAAFNMDVASFFTKWMQDMTDAQLPSGGIPSTVPFCVSIPNEGGPAWSDAVVICPWTIYLCYGDRRILAERWDTMTRFMDYLRREFPDFIRSHEKRSWGGYGDWLNQNAETPKDYIGTAFFAHCATLMSRIATILGKSDAAKDYATLFERIRGAFQRRFVTPDGLIVAQTQTAYVLALHFDLLPSQHRATALEALVKDIESRGMHLSTGFVGTPYLAHVLTEGGQLDVAYALLEQTTFPSWLYPITQGATTMWERWDGYTHDKGFHDAGMNSYNHYAYGAIGAWMYATVAGLDLDPDVPGYRRILVRPRPGGTLTHARATLHTPHGKASSRWQLRDGKIELTVVVPANTSARVRVPTSDPAAVLESGRVAAGATGITPAGIENDALVLELGAGKYRFVAPWHVSGTTERNP
jgi:alpha-L-rhamnosidase